MTKNIVMRTAEGRILHIECHESIPSTLELAKKYARLGYSDGYVVFSEKQTAFDAVGRPLSEGESENGVYLSCILRPSIFPSQAVFLGAMTAVALHNALEEQTERELGIGWVSDIYCDGRKIGTTATEGKLDSFSTFEYIIVNFYVKLTDADFPPRMSDLIKKVFVSENTSLSLIIAKKILAKFFELFPQKIKSPEKFMEIYKRKFALFGIKTKYLDGTKKKRCTILGVNGADGRLIVETAKGDIINISAVKSIALPDKIRTR